MGKPKFKIGDTLECICIKDENIGDGAGWVEGYIFKVYDMTPTVTDLGGIYWPENKSGIYENSLKLVSIERTKKKVSLTII